MNVFFHLTWTENDMKKIFNFCSHRFLNKSNREIIAGVLSDKPNSLITFYFVHVSCVPYTQL